MAQDGSRKGFVSRGSHGPFFISSIFYEVPPAFLFQFECSEETQMSNRLDTIPRVSTERFSSGIEELDWLYGADPGDSTNPFPSYGIPRGGLSLWGGESGVGKTRTTVSVAQRILEAGGSVLFFTLEMGSSRFVSSYCRDIPAGAHFFISEEFGLDGQIAEIVRLKPALVIVDSINRISEYRRVTTRATIETRYRNEVAKVTGSHIIFITHLNQEGGIKGGTDLPHMVDIVFYLECLWDGAFKVSCPRKNRFGRTGIEVWCIHDDKGVEATSEHRFDDKQWRETHGVSESDVQAARETTNNAIDVVLRSEGILAEPSPKKNRGFWTDFVDGFNSFAFRPSRRT
jgi:predicted ATP-dependent serine protease